MFSNLEVEIYPQVHLKIEKGMVLLAWFSNHFIIPMTYIHQAKTQAELIDQVKKWISLNVAASVKELDQWAYDTIVNPFTFEEEIHIHRPYPLKCAILKTSNVTNAYIFKKDEWIIENKGILLELSKTHKQCAWGFMSLQLQDKMDILNKTIFEPEGIRILVKNNDHTFISVGNKNVLERYMDDDQEYMMLDLKSDRGI